MDLEQKDKTIFLHQSYFSQDAISEWTCMRKEETHRKFESKRSL